MRILFVAALVVMVVAHGSHGKGSWGKGSHGKGGSRGGSHGKGPKPEQPPPKDAPAVSGDRHHRPRTALQICEDDVERYCRHFDGPARRMGCLQRVQAQLQPTCLAAVKPTVGFACAADIALYCPDVRGPGSAFDCLMTRQNEISESCLLAIDRLDQPLSLQLGLNSECATEAKTFCSGESTAVGMILCLRNNAKDLSQSCLRQVEPLVSFNCVPDVPAICPRQQGRLGFIQCLKDHTAQLSPRCQVALNPPEEQRRSGESWKEGKKHGRCGMRQMFGLGLSAESWGYDEDRSYGWAHRAMHIAMSVGGFLVCCLLGLCCCRRIRKRRAARRQLRLQQQLAAQPQPLPVVAAAVGGPALRVEPMNNPALYPAQQVSTPSSAPHFIAMPVGSAAPHPGSVPIAAPVVDTQPGAPAGVRYLVQAVPVPPPSPANANVAVYAPLYPQFNANPTQLRQPLLGTIN